MRVDTRDLFCGAFFVATGAFFATNARMTLRAGEALSMGPGYFPTLLGVLMVGLGAAIALRAFGRAGEAIDLPQRRGTVLVCSSVLIFAIGVKGLGLLPTLLVSSFVAGLAPRDSNWRSAGLVSLGITACSIAIFVFGLRLPYPLFGTWLRG